MLKLIIEKELREIVGTTKFAVTFGVCALLILLAFYVGARNYQVSQTEYSAAVTENLKNMEGLTDWNQIDHRIFLEPRPLAALVSGVSNDVGRTIEVEGVGELRTEDSRFNEDPIYAVFRFLDLEFIFTIVLSLFAILFAYDAVNGEKQRGTLRLSFANPVPRDKYILGKMIGAFLALAVPLMIPLLLGFLLLPLFGVPLDSGEWVRLGMVILAGLLYLGVFLSLSVFISAMTEHSSTSFLMLLVVWIFAVLIIPRTAVLVSGRAVDVPSIDQVNYEKNQFESQLWEEDRKKMDSYWRENPPNANTSREQVMQGFRAYMSDLAVDREDKMNDFASRLNEDRRNRESAQQKVALGVARISPVAAFSLAATDLAGTSLELKQRYIEAANDYQQTYANFLVQKTGGRGGWWSRMTRNNNEDADPIDPRELPVFEYETPETSTLITSSLFDLGLLTFFNILFFAGAFVAFLKYDVR